MYRGSCQALCEVSLLLSWKLFRNGPVIMFQIRFGGKNIFLLYCWLRTQKVGMWVFSAEERAGRVGTEWQKSYLSFSVTWAVWLYCPHTCQRIIAVSASFYTFFPERGVKHQGLPMHTPHRPKSFERKDFWPSSAEKGWQNTTWDFPHTRECHLSCHSCCQSFVLLG